MRRRAEAGEKENRADALAMAEMFGAWNRLPRPVVGRIQGAALGGGVGLVCVTDIAVAARGAVFGFTEIRLGILPAVISPFATARIGHAAARELFLTGERFSAERAKEIGLVQRVVAAEELDAEIDRVVDALLAGGPLAQARVKRLLREIAGKHPEEVREETAHAIAQARGGAEGQEGIQAFLEKREPSWRGRR
jgi:methylglutaconyl-CoA hydratase